MVVLIQVIQTVYLALLQYGLLIWGGFSANALKPLLIQQRQVVRICLQKPTRLLLRIRQQVKTLNY